MVLDSVSVRGDRLVTIQATMHRFVLAELNTHRAFSRNSASSRAVPIRRVIDGVRADPALPIEWGRNRSGMQATERIDDHQADLARSVWLDAMESAVRAAEQLAELGVHKQVVNRLLEPFSWHDVVITTTMPGLENFLRLRSSRFSSLAQPEIAALADAIADAVESSTPTPVPDGEWHLPFIQPDEDLDDDDARAVSAARCARISYGTRDDPTDVEADLARFWRLVSAKPPHSSPMEHVATPVDRPVPGNLVGWLQLRHVFEAVTPAAYRRSE